MGMIFQAGINVGATIRQDFGTEFCSAPDTSLCSAGLGRDHVGAISIRLLPHACTWESIPYIPFFLKKKLTEFTYIWNDVFEIARTLVTWILLQHWLDGSMN